MDERHANGRHGAVAFWITWLMMVWKPLVMPLSCFCKMPVVVHAHVPQIRLLFAADAVTEVLHLADRPHRHRSAATDAVQHA